METFRYPQFPPEFATVNIALFTDVQNASELKKRLVAASVMPGEEGEVEREAVNYAFVDARLVCVPSWLCFRSDNSNHITGNQCAAFADCYISRDPGRNSGLASYQDRTFRGPMDLESKQQCMPLFRTHTGQYLSLIPPFDRLVKPSDVTVCPTTPKPCLSSG